jgi:hypothetical protein
MDPGGIETDVNKPTQTPTDPIVITDPAEADQRLAALGLDAELLREAVRAGMMVRATCTAFDPISLPGTVLWGRATRVLREQLRTRSEEWRAEDDRNLPLAVNVVSRLAIAVSSANENVGNGDVDRPPANRNPKGAVCYDLVAANTQQILFPRNQEFLRTPKKKECVTWLLLVHATDDSAANCELSLPQSISKGWIGSWKERIMLNPVVLDEEQESARPGGDLPPEIDVPVTRKNVA